MKVLALGDIAGKAGRLAIENDLPLLKEKYNLDCVIVNADNAAHGFGMSDRIAGELFDCGVDIISTGDHYTDRDTLKVADKYPNVVRPANLPKVKEGRGHVVLNTGKEKILFISVMGRLYMDDPRREPSNPYHEVRKILDEYKDIKIKIVEIHAEATSEKVGMGHYLKGEVSAVFGSHTHVQTSDLKILEGGTGYITDLGMCGDQNSMLGAKTESALPRLLESAESRRLEPAEGVGTVSGVIFDIDPKTGKCTDVILVN